MSALDRLPPGASDLEGWAALPRAERASKIAGLSSLQLATWPWNWPFLSREAQRAPESDWRTWMILAGRGFGKTRAGAEWVRALAETGVGKRIALVGASLNEARAVMVEGESGLLAIAPPGKRPKWEASLRKLSWEGGATAFVYSAGEPESLRGPQHHFAWCDEIGKWRDGMETWTNLAMGLRLGTDPRTVVTTTPRAVPLVRMLAADGKVAVTRGRMSDNRAHLARSFVDEMGARYGGTLTGRQELDGELIDEIEGALWTRPALEAARVAAAPPLARVVAGGFLLPGEADPVWAGDVDRLFISLVAPGYTKQAQPLAQPAEAHVTLDAIACEGARSVLAIGEATIPAHALRMATGYDDLYDQTPARVARTLLHLGYRGPVNHYVGMSHYFRLGTDLKVDASGTLNVACAAWHASFARELAALGFGLILSQSYELLDQHCPEAWKQRAADGTQALTGWVPPSTLLSPANAEAMAYLRRVAQAFVAFPQAAGLPVRFQVGEPWWWVTADGRPCLYDAAAKAAFGGTPVAIPSVRGALSPAQIALLDQAGALLASSTAALRAAVRQAAPGAEVMLLAYLPTVLDPAAPEIRRANLPMGWANPAFDRLQLEDYDWVTAGDTGATARGIAAALARLGYSLADTHYFSGFVLNAGDAPRFWPPIAAALTVARTRGHADIFVWALPQVARDGFTWFEIGDTPVQAFDDVDFPIAIGRQASVEPGFSTAVVTSAAGVEQRNADWAQGRLRFDAGPGVRSGADIQALLGFFRARRGMARGFRFRDPLDDRSAGMTDPCGAKDVVLGTGDGSATRFPLVKPYGAGTDPELRRITRPIAGSVRVAVGGTERLTGWTVEAGGIVSFQVAPPAGALVQAGFRFAVPVRFAEDQLQVSLASVTAGEAPSVPLVEIRELFA